MCGNFVGKKNWTSPCEWTTSPYTGSYTPCSVHRHGVGIVLPNPQAWDSEMLKFKLWATPFRPGESLLMIPIALSFWRRRISARATHLIDTTLSCAAEEIFYFWTSRDYIRPNLTIWGQNVPIWGRFLEISRKPNIRSFPGPGNGSRCRTPHTVGENYTSIITIAFIAFKLMYAQGCAHVRIWSAGNADDLDADIYHLKTVTIYISKLKLQM